MNNILWYKHVPVKNTVSHSIAVENEYCKSLEEKYFTRIIVVSELDWVRLIYSIHRMLLLQPAFLQTFGA